MRIRPRLLLTIALLAAIGTPAVPALIAALQQTNCHIQNRAILLLGRIHSQPDASIPALTALLASTNFGIRANALNAIHAFGPAANQSNCVPKIIGLLNDSEGYIHQHATNTLRLIDPAAAAAAKAGIK